MSTWAKYKRLRKRYRWPSLITAGAMLAAWWMREDLEDES